MEQLSCHLCGLLPGSAVHSGMGRQWTLFWLSRKLAMVVNIATTIATFLMAFVIRNSQDRDGLALQIKLDEIIRALGTAQNSFIDLEDRPQEELDLIKSEFATIAVEARIGKAGSASVTVGVA